jgi:TonB family protein
MTHRFATWTLLISLQLGTIGALPCIGQDTAARNSIQAPVPRVSISSSIAGGMLVSKVNPVYPPLARQARITGTVIMKAAIGLNGDIESIELVSGHPLLAPAALAAVKQWKYKPFLVNGGPVEVSTQIQVNFQLSGNPSPGSSPEETQEGSSAGNVPAPVPAQPSSAAPQSVRVSSGVMLGFLESRVNPIYPPDAKEQHIQGVVLLQVVIDKEGNVSSVSLISGDPLLAPAAIEAVKQWKYKPYRLNGNPVEVQTQIQTNFKLAH